MTGWDDRIEARLGDIASAGRWRTTRAYDGPGPEFILDGRRVVSFASNDYLGLSSHGQVVAAGVEAAHQWGASSTASRLVVGGRPVHDELEADLADWKGTEAALVFPTGYAANLGVITTLADSPDVLVVSDELNHASIIDGCRLGRGRVTVVGHRDVDAVAGALADHDGPAVVVTESVFSMDGDVAPVDELAELTAERGALLVVDEAHGILDTLGPIGGHVVRIGTLSKALGSLGGFVATTDSIRDLLVNSARSFIFTTAPAPAAVAAARAALVVVRSAEGLTLRERLRRNIDAVRPGHPSPIIPVVVGSEDAAVELAAKLLVDGLLVPAIRPPTVPPGTSRLRVAMSAAHDPADVERLAAALADYL